MLKVSAEMRPAVLPRAKPIGQEQKSWKKINEERKTLRRERRQDRLIKQVENVEKLKELTKTNEEGEAQIAKKLNPSTVSIAVPGSILENAQSPALRSYLAGQVARAASIFRVNEIVVFDDIGVATVRDTKVVYETETNGEGETIAPQTARKSSLQLARILQYLECPQYLRKFFFPLHKDLANSGVLNPLDTPHHLRQQSMFLYREGIITERQAKGGRSFANVGLQNDVLIDKAITPGVRVTVKLKTLNESKKLRGTVVSPDEPRRETGVYWGYTVRIAHSLADVFTKSPYSGGYDRTIGTSDRGSNIQEVPEASCHYNHLLIVFGGVAGLETALSNDEKLSADDPALLFDHYLNVLPKQGSRTIRTEEAILIALTALQEKLAPQVADIEDKEYKDLLPRSDDSVVRKFNASLYVEEKIENPFNKPAEAKNTTSNSNKVSEEQAIDSAFSSTNFSRSEVAKCNPFTTKVQNNERNPAEAKNTNSNCNNVSEKMAMDNAFSSTSFSRSEFVKRNPFTTKVHNNERKRKHLDNGEKHVEMSMPKVQFNKQIAGRPEKSSNEQKQKEKAPPASSDINDFEVVPASGTIHLTKQKRPKEELDLSRFD